MVCVPTILLGNAYLCDEHFISSIFGEVTLNDKDAILLIGTHKLSSFPRSCVGMHKVGRNLHGYST